MTFIKNCVSWSVIRKSIVEDEISDDVYLELCFMSCYKKQYCGRRDFG